MEKLFGLPIGDIMYNPARKWELGAHFWRVGVYMYLGGNLTEVERDVYLPWTLRVREDLSGLLSDSWDTYVDLIGSGLEEDLPDSGRKFMNESLSLLREVHLGFYCEGLVCFECLFLKEILDDIWEETERFVENIQIWGEDVDYFLSLLRGVERCDLPEGTLLPGREGTFDPFKIGWEEIKLFFTRLDGEEIPNLGRSLPYALKRALGECRYESLPLEERLLRLDDSLWASFWTLLFFSLVPFILGVPLPLLALFSPIIFSLLILFTLEWTWGWSLGCFPALPYELGRDLERYWRARLVPGPLSDKFPTLGQAGTLNCTGSGWTSCSCEIEEAEWHLCPLEGYDSYFFAPLVFLKLNFPDWYLFFYETFPFNLVQDWDLYFKVWGMEENQLLYDCLWTRGGDLFLPFLLLYLGFALLIGLASLSLSLFSVFWYSIPPTILLLAQILGSLLD